MTNRQSKPNRRNSRRFWWIVAGVILLIVLYVLTIPNDLYNSRISLDRFASYIKDGEVEKVEVHGGQDIIIYLQNGSRDSYYKEREGNLFDALKAYGVTEEMLSRITYSEEPADTNLLSLGFQLLVSAIPSLILVLPLYVMMRKALADQQRVIDFGRTNDDVLAAPGDVRTRFSDVGGMEQAKAQLYPIIRFVREPDQFVALGAALPKTILLTGVPGSGKSLLARAFAGEMGIPFYQMNGSEFAELFVGVGASRIRSLFQSAEATAPSLIVIDELDAIGHTRGESTADKVESRQTLQQLLLELDDETNNVIVIGATNRPDLLDPALVRSGRFDHHVTLGVPDMQERAAILAICTKNKPLAPDVNLQEVAQWTEGFVAADLVRLANEAAMIAAIGTRKRLTMRDFEDALQRMNH